MVEGRGESIRDVTMGWMTARGGSEMGKSTVNKICIESTKEKDVRHVRRKEVKRLEDVRVSYWHWTILFMRHVQPQTRCLVIWYMSRNRRRIKQVIQVETISFFPFSFLLLRVIVLLY